MIDPSMLVMGPASVLVGAWLCMLAFATVLARA